ncbi:uncharacterized protein [Dermacentor andersoni]|uniref:uncharacterized protein isoform X3 n=1 Tax=Dermacentor andersoni TaxID=34620 RepID=UPI0024171D07|nr:uncharacterized protein LOC126537435 isoform X3 [Dermacentor andersoni]
MAPWRLRVSCVLLAAFLVLTPLARAEEAQQQTAQAGPPGTGDQRAEKQTEQVKETATKNSSQLEAPPVPLTKQGDSVQAAKTTPPVKFKDSTVQDAKNKAERIEPSEAPKEAEGNPRGTSDSHDTDGGSADDQRRGQQPMAASMEDDAREGGASGSGVGEEEQLLLEDSADPSALEDLQHLRDVLDGRDSRREEGEGSLSALVKNALSSMYSIITYDFCQASAAIPAEPSNPQRAVHAQTSPPAPGKGGEDKGAGDTKALSCTQKGGRLADWRAWREVGHRKPKAVLARLACLLRSAGYRLYPLRRPAQFWPQGDVCTALCHSCECDYDANSTCSLAREAWKARTPAVLYALYSVLHHSRALCATALLLSVLRKHYVYRIVLCTPLIILLAMVTRCLYVLMQLRRYLENSATPAINTRDCSNRHSEDEEISMSPLERHRRRDLLFNEEHPDKHAEALISKLNHAMSSLRSFCTFLETTRGYYKTRTTPCVKCSTLCFACRSRKHSLVLFQPHPNGKLRDLALTRPPHVSKASGLSPSARSTN